MNGLNCCAKPVDQVMSFYHTFAPRVFVQMVLQHVVCTMSRLGYGLSISSRSFYTLGIVSNYWIQVVLGMINREVGIPLFVLPIIPGPLIGDNYTLTCCVVLDDLRQCRSSPVLTSMNRIFERTR